MTRVGALQGSILPNRAANEEILGGLGEWGQGSRV